MYSSKWKDNMLVYLIEENNNSKDIINDFLNEAKKYSIKINDNMRNIYGITQSPETKEYFMVLQKGLLCEKCYINIIDKQSKWCKLCQINFQTQLKINYQTDIVVEWIPYNQLNNIKEKVINNLTSVYSAIWKEVILKWLHNFQNITDEFLNKIIKTYSIKKQNNIRNIYGITQSPDTKDYIMVLEINSEYCEKCDKICKYSWCESCEINFLKENFTNWTSGNKEIDNFIQKMQLKITSRYDIILEWIPYNQFDNIKEMNKDGVAEAIKNNSTHSAIWKNDCQTYSIRKHNDDIRNIYGITQSLNTKEYILVLEDGYCIKCYKQCTNKYNKWCKPCEINSLKENFVNWTSGNEMINDFIQKMQLKITSGYDIIFEWISYNQFDSIKEIFKIDSIPVHSAIWKDGPLNYELDDNEYKYIRNKNKNVILKCLHNSQNITDEFLNEIVETYSIRQYNTDDIRNIYGITQSPNTKEYIIILQYGSYCEKCNKIYTEKDYRWYIVFEWIPYNQFSNNKEIDFGVVYSAIWKDGPLNYNKDKMKYIRSQVTQNKNVTLKYLHGFLQNITDELIFKIYSIKKHDDIRSIYGMSQNPNTKEFIMVLQDGRYCEICDKKYTDLEHKWCKPCQIKSFQRVLGGKNEKINNFIREMRLKIDTYNDTVIEWIPYNQFNDIKEIVKNDSVTIYSAIWMSVQLYYNEYENKYTRNQIRKNQAKEYSIKYNDEIRKIYGITQTPYTQNYIMVLQDGYCAKCSKKYTNLLTKWCKSCEINSIEKNFFGDIKEVVKTDSDTVYSVIWKNGPLVYDKDKIKYIRSQNKKVALKYLHNSQNTTTEFLNEIIKLYSIKEYNFNRNIYGLTQNPDTKEYITILQDGYCEKCGKKYFNTTLCTWCKPFQIDYGFTSINEKSNLSSSNTFKFDFNFTSNKDNFKKHHITTINDSELIPYSQFNNIKEIESTNKNVALKYLHISQNINKEFLEKVKIYSVKNSYILDVYGITRNPDTKEYIIVLKYVEGESFDNWIIKNYKFLAGSTR
ncbi:unnamed protein product [Rhizophagus irregularis]|nr:unnamed protein product [Rhizophagus irregularis]